MCFLTRCKICGELMEYEDYLVHSSACKPLLESVVVTTKQTVNEKKKKVK